MKRDLAKILSFTVPNGDCLEWTRCFNTDGYPRAAIDGHSNGKVHRIVWELVHSESAEGRVVRHTCDNPKCINPDHLIIGTNAENMHDKFLRNRQPRVITRDTVRWVNHLLKIPNMRQIEIAYILGIDARRVSDISCGKYCSATGKFLGHGKRRF